MDLITLTSSNIARALLSRLDAVMIERIAKGDIQLVSISPVTSAAIREMGFAVAAEATRYTAAGVVEAIVRHVGRS